MADYPITKADVVPTIVGNVKPIIKRLTAGGAITAGEGVALNATDGLAYINDASDADIDFITGIALNDATAGQPVDVQQGGYVTVSAVGAIGDVVVMSQTAGGLASHADLVATNDVAILGYFTTTSLIKIAISNLEVQRG